MEFITKSDYSRQLRQNPNTIAYLSGSTSIGQSLYIKNIEVDTSGATIGSIFVFDGIKFKPSTVSGTTVVNGTGVTLVGLSLPPIFNVTNSPVTTTGTLTATLAIQTNSKFFASPITGGTPEFRQINVIDLPSGIPISILTASGITFSAGTIGNDINWSNIFTPLGNTATINIPDASNINRGVVTPNNQTFNGIKSFNSGITINNNNSILFNDSDNSNYVGIKSSPSVNTNYIISLPSSVPFRNTTLGYDGTNYLWLPVITGATNLGGGIPVYNNINDAIISFNSLSGGSNTTVNKSGNTIIINTDLSNYVTNNALTAVTSNLLIKSDFNTYSANTLNLISNSATGVTYINPNPTTQTVGGIFAGSTFATPKSMQYMWDLLLYPYQNPSFNSFNIGKTNPQEVGATISGVTSFTWGTNNSSNVMSNSILIRDITNSVILGSSLVNDGSENLDIGTITKNSHGLTHNWRIEGVNTNSVGFQSGNISIVWYFKTYSGTNTNQTLIETDIESLANNILVGSLTTNHNLASGGYKYICFPDGFGSPTSTTGFRDNSTLLPISMADNVDNIFYNNTANGWNYGLVSVTNIYGITTNYRVYRSKYVLGGSIQINVS